MKAIATQKKGSVEAGALPSATTLSDNKSSYVKAPRSDGELVYEARFLRLPEVLKIIPVSRTVWWEGVRTGRYPRGVKLSPRTTAWKASEILALIDSCIAARDMRGAK